MTLKKNTFTSIEIVLYEEISYVKFFHSFHVILFVYIRMCYKLI